MSKNIIAQENHVVRFHFVLSDAAGTEVESTRDEEPVAALIGQGSLMPGLEEALLGCTAQTHIDITLEPAKAFGERRPDLTQRVSKKYLTNPARLKPGMTTQVQTDTGARSVTVIKVGGKFVDVDLNHPLAGQTVRCQLDILEVREATAEELAHGHVHGPGGHQH